MEMHKHHSQSKRWVAGRKMLIVGSTLAGQGLVVQREKKDLARQVHGVMALMPVKFVFGRTKDFEPAE